MNTPHKINLDDIKHYVATDVFASSSGGASRKRLIIETYISVGACEYVVTHNADEVYRGHNITKAVEKYNSLP